MHPWAGWGGWEASLVEPTQTCFVGPSRVQLLWEPLGPNLQNGRTGSMLVVQVFFFFFYTGSFFSLSKIFAKTQDKK